MRIAQSSNAVTLPDGITVATLPFRNKAWWLEALRGFPQFRVLARIHFLLAGYIKALMNFPQIYIVYPMWVFAEPHWRPTVWTCIQTFSLQN